MAVELGNTIAELSTSISLFALPKSLDQTTLNNPAALLALAQQSTKIGACQSMTETQRRNTDMRFQLDSDNPSGAPVERLPRTPDELSLRLDRVMLYGSTITDVLGIAADDILNNNAPFGVMKVEVKPNGSGIATKTTIFIGVWLHSVSETYNISGGDLRVVQSADAGYTSKTVVGSPTPA